MYHFVLLNGDFLMQIKEKLVTVEYVNLKCNELYPDKND